MSAVERNVPISQEHQFASDDLVGSLMLELPGWSLHWLEVVDQVETPESISWATSTIKLSTETETPERRAAHAIAHAIYHRTGNSSRFTPDEEAEANFIADCWLSWGPVRIDEVS